MKPSGIKNHLWMFEDQSSYFQTGFKVVKSLFSEQSPFQQVDVVQTEGFGNMLFHDGLVMTSEADEFVYHEMIAQVPMFVHPNPKNVLIIGGGDGGTLREVLRHKSVEQCVMVEIDEVVVRACKEHLKVTASGFSDPRAKVLFEDGVKYVKGTTEKFDVVIIDSSDPIGPATPLFNVEFYNDVKKRMNESAVLIAQAENAYFEKEAQISLLKVHSEVFEKRFLYNYFNMTYPGGFWSFLFSSDKYDPIVDFDEKRILESGLDFKYYNKEIHKAAFALPEFMVKDYKGLVSR